jgi:hypothetical protein
LSRRHLIIPDTQLRPGVPTSHIDWCAQAIVDYKPDVLVVLGDWWDMHSLSMYDAPGSKSSEGINVKADIDIGNEAFERLVAPMNREIARRVEGHRKRWEPECHFLFGNHEDRITRALSREPKWEGVLSLDMLKTPGFTRHAYQKIVYIDGIAYCHFFPNPYTGRAIGGTILNRLNHVGSSFVQGHQQGFMYASKQYPDHVKHGLVAGRFYQHHEGYRPEDVQRSEWSGIVVLNEVKDGDYCIMPLTMDYLRRTYGG